MSKQITVTEEPEVGQAGTSTGYVLSGKLQANSTTVVEETSELEPLENESGYPEGGLQAYLVVFGSFLGLVPVFGLINSIGAIEAYVSQNQLANVKPSTVSWIFSIYLSMSFAASITSGGYFDRNGPRMPMFLGTVLYTAGLVATASSKSVVQFIIAFSIVCGAGTGILSTPLVACIATWFLRNRATATSIATVGGSIGGIVFPIMLKKLYTDVGFAWAIRILALICFVCLCVSTYLCTERIKSNSAPFSSWKTRINWYAGNSFNYHYLLDFKFLFIVLGASLAENSLMASATYLTSYSLRQGNSETASYALITVTNAVGILGRYIPALLSDKYVGRFNTMIVTLTAAAIFNFTLWLPLGHHLKVLYAYCALYGFASGSILSLVPVCIGQISKTQDFGKRYSTSYLVQAVLTLPVIPICGAIIGNQSKSNYNNYIVFSSILMALASLCYLVSRYLCVGWKMCKF